MSSIAKPILPLALVLALTVSACDSTGLDVSSPVTFNVSAAAPGPAASVAPKAASGHVEITDAVVLLKSIRFHAEGEEPADEGQEPAEDDTTQTFHTGPVVIHLVEGGVVGTATVDVADVPGGTYHSISFHLHKPRGNQEVEDYPEFSGDGPHDRWSVVIDGLHEGSPFQYRSQLNVVQVVDFDEPFVIEDGAPHAVTLQVELAKWFVAQDGTDLDPTDGSEGNRAAIDRSLRESFRLFQDDDEDGEPG